MKKKSEGEPMTNPEYSGTRKTLFLAICITVCLAGGFGRLCYAASTLLLSPSAESAYVLQGVGLEQVSAMDILVRYDASTLASPKSSQGELSAGAMMAVNDTVPGVVRLALIRATPMSGTGTLATLTFARPGEAPGKIIALQASFSNSAGRPVAVQAQFENPADKAADAPVPAAHDGQTAGTVISASAAGGTMQTAPVIAAAPPGPVQEEKKPDVSSETTAPIPEAAPGPDLQEKKTEQAPRKKIQQYKSVLDRFREYKGKGSPRELAALFPGSAAEARQDPPIVLSDGKATVKVVVELNSRGEDNNMLLDGVSLVSLKNKDKNYWIAELLPDKNASEASISIPRAGHWQVMPLIVSPPVEAWRFKFSGKLSPADFRLFLKERGTVKNPRFDLNADGRRDYKDEYIFTANYLAIQKK